MVVGSAACVWDDLKSYRNQVDVMCINDMGMYFPGRMRHWYSNDAHMLARWKHCRRPDLVRKYGRDWLTHSNYVGSHYPDGPIDYWWPFPGQGTSGLTGCLVGLALGYHSIVLAGVPLDGGPHFFDAPEVSTSIDRESRDEIVEFKLRILKGKVTSLSGRTREWFGSP